MCNVDPESEVGEVRDMDGLTQWLGARNQANGRLAQSLKMPVVWDKYWGVHHLSFWNDLLYMRSAYEPEWVEIRATAFMECAMHELDIKMNFSRQRAKLVHLRDPRAQPLLCCMLMFDRPTLDAGGDEDKCPETPAKKRAVMKPSEHDSLQDASSTERSPDQLRPANEASPSTDRCVAATDACVVPTSASRETSTEAQEAGGNDDELGGADEVLPSKQSEAGHEEASLEKRNQFTDVKFDEKTFAPSLPLLADAVVESR